MGKCITRQRRQSALPRFLAAAAMAPVLDLPSSAATVQTAFDRLAILVWLDSSDVLGGC